MSFTLSHEAKAIKIKEVSGDNVNTVTKYRLTVTMDNINQVGIADGTGTTYEFGVFNSEAEAVAVVQTAGEYKGEIIALFQAKLDDNTSHAVERFIDSLH